MSYRAMKRHRGNFSACYYVKEVNSEKTIHCMIKIM